MSKEREEVFVNLWMLAISLCAYVKLIAAQNRYFRIIYAGIAVANGVNVIVEMIRKKAKNMTRGNDAQE